MTSRQVTVLVQTFNGRPTDRLVADRVTLQTPASYADFVRRGGLARSTAAAVRRRAPTRGYVTHVSG